MICASRTLAAVTGIRLHREHHLYGQARVGLERIFTHDLGSID